MFKIKSAMNMSRHNQKSLNLPLAFRRGLNFAFAALIFFWVAPAYASPPHYIPVCSIQGNSFSSPYQGWTVRTRGVVTMDLDQATQRGFFLQAPNCDNLSSTSNGIFVFLGVRIDVVTTGDQVEVTGFVDEYFGQTELQVAPANVNVLSHDNPLPAVVQLNPPFPNDAVRSFFESLEGMYVGLSLGQVVGPTDTEDRTWLVNANLGVSRVFYGDPRGTGEVICTGDDGLYKVTPQAKVGDTVQNLVGVLDYRLGIYCLEPSAAPLVVPAAPIPEISGDSTSNLPTFSLATFNLEGMFDTVDDPLTGDPVISPTEYQRRLRKHALAIGQELGHPAILAVQEVENLTVLQDLVARPEMQATYAIIWQEGIDPRGLDVALLYRPDQVNIISYQSRQGCTGLVDGLEPDGNNDLANPQNALTCDRDGDGLLDGNRLFSRPPLLVHLLARPSGAPTSYVDLWLIVCHFKSKIQDTSTIQYTLPRRLEMARFVASLAQDVLSANPLTNIVVLGDLNDHPDSQPLAEFFGRGFRNAMNWAEKDARYTYIYQGISQTLDYLLLYPQPTLLPVSVTPVHINADYPVSYLGDIDTPHRSSDHDPIVVSFTPVEPTVYLPVVRR
jgi:predicted extracellular nuclease